MSLIIPFSEACERNKDPILERLSPYLTNGISVLEIGTGTGQHVVHFAPANNEVIWQPTDQAQYLDGIAAQLQTRSIANINPALELDVTVRPWLGGSQQFDLIYSANTLHIMPWDSVTDFFAGLQDVSTQSTTLFVYGPFKFGGEHTSASNAAFDQSLQARGVGSGIRDFEALDALASDQGFQLEAKHAMPANNFCLIWRRIDS